MARILILMARKRILTAIILTVTIRTRILATRIRWPSESGLILIARSLILVARILILTIRIRILAIRIRIHSDYQRKD